MFEKLYPQSEIKVLLISISLHLIFWVSPFLSISKTKLYVVTTSTFGIKRSVFTFYILSLIKSEYLGTTECAFLHKSL